MSDNTKLFSFGFLAINLQFALVTSIAALFFAFAEYLNLLEIPPATAGFIHPRSAIAITGQPFPHLIYQYRLAYSG